MTTVVQTAPDTADQPARPPETARTDGHPWATPLARALARERGVDLTSGAVGPRVVRAGDVETLAAPHPTEAVPTPVQAAPDAASQPAEPPQGTRPGGGPWATPLARALARERGLDLTSVAVGERAIRADDLDTLAPARASAPAIEGPAAAVGTPEEATAEGEDPATAEEPASERPAGERPAVTAIPHILTAEVDITALVRHIEAASEAFERRERARPSIMLLVAQATLRSLSTAPGLLGAEYPGASIRLLVEDADGQIGIDEAEVLNLGGLARALDARRPATDPGSPGLLILDSGRDGIDLELRAPAHGFRAALSVGSMHRRVQVIAGQDGDTFGVRSCLSLGLTVNATQVERSQAVAFLTKVRDVLGNAESAPELTR